MDDSERPSPANHAMDDDRSLEPTRPLRLPDDVAAAGEIEEGGSEVFFLDDGLQWALLVPEGAVLHAHGEVADDEAETMLFECEPAESPTGEALVRCSECGASISEAEVEAMIHALGDEAE